MRSRPCTSNASGRVGRVRPRRHAVHPGRTALPARSFASEDGFVAGAESLLFGVLLFVVGTLVVVNAWSVVDARFATSAAAREAVRVAVEAPPGADVDVAASAAARAAFAGHGRDPSRLQLRSLTALEQHRCAEFRFEASTTVVPVLLPGVGSGARVRVASTHAEVVDPYRSGLPEGVDCGW